MLYFLVVACAETLHDGISAKTRAEEDTGWVYPVQNMQYLIYRQVFDVWSSRKQRLAIAAEQWAGLGGTVKAKRRKKEVVHRMVTRTRTVNKMRRRRRSDEPSVDADGNRLPDWVVVDPDDADCDEEWERVEVEETYEEEIEEDVWTDADSSDDDINEEDDEDGHDDFFKVMSDDDEDFNDDWVALEAKKEWIARGLDPAEFSVEKLQALKAHEEAVKFAENKRMNDERIWMMRAEKETRAFIYAEHRV